MFDHVRSDLRRWAPPSQRATSLRPLVFLGNQALLVYRLGRWLHDAREHPARFVVAALLAPVYLVLSAYVRFAYDIRLEPTAEIGPGLKIFHFGGIRLRSCKLGAGCVIHQQVTVEPASVGGAGPEIGDHVWIGPHAHIVGPVKVGDHATIAAGALVTQDVAGGALVVGCPAKTVRINYDNAALL